MAVSVDTEVKELMKNEAAAEILEKFAPGFKTNPQMKLVGGAFGAGGYVILAAARLALLELLADSDPASLKVYLLPR